MSITKQDQMNKLIPEPLIQIRSITSAGIKTQNEKFELKNTIHKPAREKSKREEETKNFYFEMLCVAISSACFRTLFGEEEPSRRTERV